ncbi:MAG: tetratricopeptide repeat protein [Deltaproteobacteria bacterium]|nr:tetratricopeptide repeat protein [Deltaproteobacteria bacterium]
MTRRNILSIFAAGAMVLAACASPSPERKREADARMHMGVTYLGQRNLPAAMRELIRASELDPENPEIDMVLGLAYRSRGDLGEAERHFRNAIEKKPDYADAHNNLGIVLSNLGRGDEALGEFEAAASNVLYPTPEWAYYNMGEEYRRRKNMRKAEEMYRRAISLNDRYSAPYLMLALLQGDRGQWREAAGTLEACVAAAPSYAPAWLSLGRAYLSLGRQQDALHAFRNVLSNSTDQGLRKQASDSINALERGKR